MPERSNSQWLAELRSSQPDQALSDLRAILKRGLRYALVNRVGPAELEPFIEDSLQEALLKIRANLDTFRGESRLTTWAHKIAVRVALTELRRQHWKDISLEDLIPPDESGDFTPAALSEPGPTPENQALRNSMLETVGRLINEELTERQRQAMLAVVLGGMPMEEVARRMDTNRNALYKLLHDARQRLQMRLQAEGLTPQDVLGVFRAD